MKIFFGLTALVTSVSAALFGAYFDAECTNEIVPVHAFTDVCTWATNKYDGAYSFYLESCSETSIHVFEQKVNNSESFTCQGNALANYTVTPKCTQIGFVYTKLLDGSICEGKGTTYDVVAYNISDCSVGGLPFTVVYNNGECNGDSFAPGVASWDTRLSGDANGYYMEVFESTDGQCANPLGLFETKGFPSGCLAPVAGFYNTTFVEIWEAFPLNF